MVCSKSAPVPGEPLYEACVTRVEKFLYKKLLKVSEAELADFFSLSYFYDRVVDLALLGTIMLHLQHPVGDQRWGSTTSPRMHFTIAAELNIEEDYYFS